MALPSIKKRHRRPTKSSWRNYQQSSLSSKRVYLGLTVLALVVGIIIVGKLLNFVGSLGQPFSKSGQVVRRLEWDRNTNLNIVIRSQTTDFLSYNPYDRRVVIVRFPDETYLNVPGYGNWQVRSIYELGQSEKVPIGGELLKVSLSRVMGVPINGVLVGGNQLSERSTNQLLEDVRGSPTFLFSLTANSTTDLSFMEILRFWWEIRSIRFDKIQTINLAQSDITSWEVLSDGTRVLKINQPLLDQRLEGMLQEGFLARERLSVAIFNSTSHPLLADRAARIVSNLGGRVVETSTLVGDPQSLTVVIGGDSVTNSRLKRAFSPGCHKQTLFTLVLQDSCAKIVAELIGNNVELRESSLRADIVIVLGEDFAP